MSATLVVDDGEKTYTNYWVRSVPFVVIIDTTGRISTFASPHDQCRADQKRHQALNAGDVTMRAAVSIDAWR